MTSIIIAALGWTVLVLAVLLRCSANLTRKLDAKIARLTPLAEIGLRVEGQPRDENGRFKAKAK